jgi:hypothetical protein
MRIVVVGDVVVDHHVYEGERTSPSATQSRGVQVKRETGGAHALTRLISEMGNAFRESRIQRQRRPDLESNRCLNDQQEQQNDQAPHRDAVPCDPNENSEVIFGLSLPDKDAGLCGHHALAVFKQCPKHGKISDPAEANKKVWRADLLLGYGHDSPLAVGSTPFSMTCESFRPTRITDDPGELLILDDAGFVFRNLEDCWLLPKDISQGPRWIVLKMSRPVCRGPLWQALQPYRDRLIIVVSASELRHETALISSGLSWERTIEDVVVSIHSDPVLSNLKNCRHLIVAFSAEGALWIDMLNRSTDTTEANPKAELVYDASSIEGQWDEQSQGKVFGFLSCMVSAITAALVRHHFSLSSSVTGAAQDFSPDSASPTPDFVSALSVGLAAMRNLRLLGHGETDTGPPDGYPVARLAKVLASPSRAFARCSIPWGLLAAPTHKVDRPWSIAVQSQVAATAGIVPVPMQGLAHQVVQRGRRMLTHLPHARFGNLFTIDRSEIETLRTLRRLMHQYKTTSRLGGTVGKPLSIGVFGPPGAGKSFGVKQIANEIFGKSSWLEFNLSQFGEGDLIGALHQVRDKVLEVGIPVVFWDEFDSKQYHWLQYLLAPMQDGRFQEGQLSHPIGHCVFVFAGATSHTFQEFGAARPSADSTPLENDIWNQYVLAKGPDFLSRLDGYYNVLGPNVRKVRRADNTLVDDPSDTSSPIRRALLLRQFLCGDRAHRLEIDPGLLRALLEVPTYRNGARSLEKLSLSIKPSDSTMSVRRSALGSAEQLAMFVDFPDSDASTSRLTPIEIYRRFVELCRANERFQDPGLIERLAAAVHEHYLQLAFQHGMQVSEPNQRTYAQLPEDSKASNRAAALRMVDVLAIAGLRPVETTTESDIPQIPREIIVAHLEQHLENMAELEHDLWCDERQSQGWRFGPTRDNGRKIHPLLIPYNTLPEIEKEKDRNQIRSYLAILSVANLHVSF